MAPSRLVGLHIEKGFQALYAGVAHQRVDFAECFDCLCNRRRYAVGAGDIGFYGQCTAACGFDRRQRFFERGGVATNECDICASLRQRYRDASSDTATCARDECCFSCQIKHDFLCQSSRSPKGAQRIPGRKHRTLTSPQSDARLTGYIFNRSHVVGVNGVSRNTFLRTLLVSVLGSAATNST